MSVTLESMSEYAQSLVRELNLEPHPEGGWYRQTWLATQATSGDLTDQAAEQAQTFQAATTAEQAALTAGRPLASLIYFLLAEGDASAWHKVDATEIWLWHGPATVGLELGGYGASPEADPEKRTMVTLGGGIAEGTRDGDAEPVGQYVIDEGLWQRTVPGSGDALVSCVVSPGFTFDGFTLNN